MKWCTNELSLGGLDVLLTDSLATAFQGKGKLLYCIEIVLAALKNEKKE